MVTGALPEAVQETLGVRGSVPLHSERLFPVFLLLLRACAMETLPQAEQFAKANRLHVQHAPTKIQAAYETWVSKVQRVQTPDVCVIGQHDCWENEEAGIDPAEQREVDQKRMQRVDLPWSCRAKVTHLQT